VKWFNIIVYILYEYTSVAKQKNINKTKLGNLAETTTPTPPPPPMMGANLATTYT